MFNETPVVSSTRWALSRLIGICTAEQEQQHTGTRHNPGWQLGSSVKGPECNGASGPLAKSTQLQRVVSRWDSSAQPEPALRCTGDGPCLMHHRCHPYLWPCSYIWLGSATGKRCWCLNLGTMGHWPVPPCNGRSLGEGKRRDAAGQV